MFLSNFCVVILIFQSVSHVLSLPKDVEHLRDHFITNLLEENRENLKMELTEKIQSSINLKIDAFLHMMDEPVVRKRRDTNDLLLNEKSEFIIVKQNFIYHIALFLASYSNPNNSFFMSAALWLSKYLKNSPESIRPISPSVSTPIISWNLPNLKKTASLS
jgi:hypothetical protein